VSLNNQSSAFVAVISPTNKNTFTYFFHSFTGEIAPAMDRLLQHQPRQI